MDAQNLIELFIGKALGDPDADPDALVASLVAEGIDSETAECLIAFVPMAFAHVILGAAGVKLPARFLLRDARTGAPVHGLLRDEPIFVAAQARARAMLVAGADDHQSAQEIATTRAEWNAIAELVRDGSDPSGSA